MIEAKIVGLGDESEKSMEEEAGTSTKSDPEALRISKTGLVFGQ
jgi:hypothetical protein